MTAGVDRLTRVNEIMKREIAGYIESGSAMLPSGVLVSVTEVTTSVDLRNATVNVSVFGGDDITRRNVIKALLRSRIDIQKVISKNLGFKHTPKLSFMLDDRMANADKVLEILGKAASEDSDGDEA